MSIRFIHKFSATALIRSVLGANGIGAVSNVLYFHDGTTTQKVTIASDSPVVGVASGYKVARGVAAVTSAASGVATVVTGLATVVSVQATMQDDPTTTCEMVTASIGDQAGTPAAGSILLKGWKTLGGTPVAMTTTSVSVNWTAVGT